MPDYKTIDQLPVELNIRDLGGLAAKDGRHVKSGLLFRSSALAFFDEEELEPVRNLGIRTILDFRALKGIQKDPDPQLEGAVDDLNSPGELASLIFDEDQAGNAIDVLVSSYTASLAFSNESYKFMFDCLLAGEAPMLFHCSNGKDRTGVAAMLILLALGIPEEIVKEDYMQSNLNRQPEIDELMERFKLLTGRLGNARSFFTMVGGVLPQSADMLLSEILERYGTFENYMEKEYGFDREILKKFRDMYLE